MTSRTQLCQLLVCGFMILFGSQGSAQDVVDDVLMERLPEHVLATMEVNERTILRRPIDFAGEQYFVTLDKGWRPGSVLRVAFIGGTSELHRMIEESTKEISDACNIAFDFGLDQATGRYRTWSLTDTDYSADIRISFDKSGYFSLVGTDAVNFIIGSPAEAVGGRPHQCSMNFGGMNIARPHGWKRIVRHEFCHALGFRHEHQLPGGGCEASLRWEDDEGYVPQDNKTADGRYVVDASGRRPGVYTYFAGAPNNWSKEVVDHNMREHSPGQNTASSNTVDRESIMLYRFPSLLYRSESSECKPTGEGESLSSGDKDGLLKLYPYQDAEFTVRQEARSKNFQMILDSPQLDLSHRRFFEKQLESTKGGK
jgi:hypothetical protein